MRETHNMHVRKASALVTFNTCEHYAHVQRLQNVDHVLEEPIRLQIGLFWKDQKIIC